MGHQRIPWASSHCIGHRGIGLFSAPQINFDKPGARVSHSKIAVQINGNFGFLECSMRGARCAQRTRASLFPMVEFQEARIHDSIRRVLQGMEFDIDRNKFWMDRWGKRPPTLSAALDIARKDFETWPKLLPIHGHRFLAAKPCRSGNPVFGHANRHHLLRGRSGALSDE